MPSSWDFCQPRHRNSQPSGQLKLKRTDRHFRISSAEKGKRKLDSGALEMRNGFEKITTIARNAKDQTVMGSEAETDKENRR